MNEATYSGRAAVMALAGLLLPVGDCPDAAHASPISPAPSTRQPFDFKLHWATRGRCSAGRSSASSPGRPRRRTRRCADLVKELRFTQVTHILQHCRRSWPSATRPAAPFRVADHPLRQPLPGLRAERRRLLRRPCGDQLRHPAQLDPGNDGFCRRQHMAADQVAVAGPRRPSGRISTCPTGAASTSCSSASPGPHEPERAITPSPPG